MKIVDVLLEDITPYKNNPRNNDETVPALISAIEDYGFLNPLVINMEGIIIAGHTRFKAVSKMGWTKVPCYRVDLDPNRADEFRVVDNQIHDLSEWDNALLMQELREFDDIEEVTEVFGSVVGTKIASDTGMQEVKVTVQDEEKKLAELDGKFEKAAEARQASIVDCKCGNCGEIFGLKEDMFK